MVGGGVKIALPTSTLDTVDSGAVCSPAGLIDRVNDAAIPLGRLGRLGRLGHALTCLDTPGICRSTRAYYIQGRGIYPYDRGHDYYRERYSMLSTHWMDKTTLVRKILASRCLSLASRYLPFCAQQLDWPLRIQRLTSQQANRVPCLLHLAIYKRVWDRSQNKNSIACNVANKELDWPAET